MKLAVIQQQFWMKECDIFMGVKTYSDPSYILSGDHDPLTLQDLRLWKGVRINRKEPTKLGSTGTPPLWVVTGEVTDHLKTSPLSICYIVKFVSSALKDIRINRKEPQNWGSLGFRPFGWRRGSPSVNKPLPHKCYHVKFGSSRQRVYA